MSPELMWSDVLFDVDSLIKTLNVEPVFIGRCANYTQRVTIQGVTEYFFLFSSLTLVNGFPLPKMLHAHCSCKTKQVKMY